MKKRRRLKRNVTPAERRTALDDASPGDIVLFDRARGLSRLITRFSGSRYYHVGLYAGGQSVIESRVRGVKLRDVSEATLKLHFRIIPAPGGPEVGRAALDWALAQEGERYAYFSIGALILDRFLEKILGPVDIVWHQRERISCGELVAQAYDVAGHPLFPGRDPEEVAPWDFATLVKR